MAVNKGDTDTIDVERLASSIELTMSQHSFMSHKRCIFKTPVALYKHNKNAYIPNAFSIGPLHHGHPNLQATEVIKAKYLKGFIERLHLSNPRLKDFINSISALEGEARDCYAGPIDYSREEFVKILIIDGCFILELFRRYVDECFKEENDPIFSSSSMVEVLHHDLILLENQVPWMVLEHLFSFGPTCGRTLIEIAIKFFRDVFDFPQSKRHDILQDIKHIPDLFKKQLVSSIEMDEEGRKPSGGRWELIHSATHLKEFGINFRKSTSKNIFDIKFINGTLEIPQIMIHEDTETFFRNLISFEQCYPDSDDRITSYAILLDNLINTAEDVEILSEKKIIDNWLSPEDAALFFNRLYLNTGVKKFCHGNVCKQVKEYCGEPRHKWRAMLVRDYFNTPWTVISTIAAVYLLILTSVQTWYSVKS